MPDKDILGISAYYHDSAACLVRDGEIVAAAQEERFTRKKHDAGFPDARRRVLPARSRHQRRTTSTTSASTTSRCSSSSASSRPTSASRRAASGRSSRPCRSGSRRSSTSTAMLRDALAATTGDVLFAEHHESHAASAFFPSPFEEAAILTLDGVGEWATASIGVGRGNDIELLRRAALARLARPALLRVHLLHRLQGQLRRVQGDGPRAVRRAEVRRPDLERADRPAGGRLVPLEPEVLQLPRRPDDDQRRVRRAVRRPAARARDRSSRSARWTSRASVQEVSEEIMLRMARTLHRETGLREPLPGRRRGAQLRRQRPAAARRAVRAHLDPAGGRRCRRRARRRAAHLAPAPRASRARSRRDATRCRASYLGPEFTPDEIERFLDVGRRRLRRGSTATELLDARRRSCSPTRRSSAGSTAAWSSARARSARAASSATRAARGCRRDEPQDQVPRGLPAVRAERAARARARTTSSSTRDSPYMLLVAPVQGGAADPDDAPSSRSCGASSKLNVPRSDIPAVTHVDYSARVQTVTRETNPRLLRPDHGVRATHRLPGARQHVVQRARRADRLHAGGRLPLLHAHGHRHAGAGPFLLDKSDAAGVEGDRGLAAGVPARLTAREGRRFGLTVGAGVPGPRRPSRGGAGIRRTPIVLGTLGGVLVLAGLVIPRSSARSSALDGAGARDLEGDDADLHGRRLLRRVHAGRPCCGALLGIEPARHAGQTAELLADRARRPARRRCGASSTSRARGVRVDEESA